MCDREQTPCEKLGYELGDNFIVENEDSHYFAKGSRVKLMKDDGTDQVWFCDGGGMRQYMRLHQLRKIEPETTADAIERIDKGMDSPAPKDNIESMMAEAEHQVAELTKKKYSFAFVEGQWIITVDDMPVPLHEIINILNGR